MANLKELKNQIDSVRSTRKITQAMKMVAASKLRRAQESAESARPYSEKISKIMSSPIVDINNNIFFSDDNGTIFCINQDGKLKWKKKYLY